MKTLLLCFIFLAGKQYAQNDSCIQIRWLSVDVNTSHSRFLNMDDDSSFYSLFFNFIKKEKQIIFLENDDILGKWEKNYPTLKTPNRINIILLNDRRAFQNEYGYDLLFCCGGGMGCIDIPKDSTYFFDPSLTMEFRMREERYYDSIQQHFSWKLTGINAYSTYFEPQGKPIWIDVQRMLKEIDNPQKYFWFKFITEREYLGEQYMQISCERYEYGKMWR